jgi:uncharacterized membrane protein YgcG
MHGLPLQTCANLFATANRNSKNIIIVIVVVVVVVVIIIIIIIIRKNRDSAVGIAMGYGLDGRGSIPCRGKNSSFLHGVQNGSGAQPASSLMGTGGSFPGGKAAGP